MSKTWDDYMGWEASNKGIAQLDRDRFLLNSDLANLSTQLGEGYPSDVTIRRMQKRMSRMRTAVKKTNARTKFDRILRKDISSNLDVVEAYLNYQFFWDPKDNQRTTIDELLDEIFEREGVITFLKGFAHRMDQSAQDKVYRLSRSVSSYQYPWKHKKVHMEIVKYLKKVPGICKRFLKETGLDDCKDLDITVMLEEGGSVGEYHNDLFLMKLDPEVLFYYPKDDGELGVRRSIFLLGAIHETGHMLNDRLGPFITHRGAQFHAETLQEITHGVTIEGLARWTETVGVRWLEYSKGTLELEDKGLEVAKLTLTAERQALVLPALYWALSAQVEENALEDASEEMARIMGYPAIQRDGGELFGECDLEDALSRLNAVLGYRHVEQLMRRVEKKVRKEHGSQFVKDHWGLLARGLYIGAWRPKTHERFVLEEYIPRCIDYIVNELE